MVTCTQCGATYEQYQPKCSKCSYAIPKMDPPLASSTKRCPFCAEDIQLAAIVCKHCGRDLPTPPVVTAQPAATATPAKKPSPANTVVSLIALAIFASLVLSVCTTVIQRDDTSAPSAGISSAAGTPTAPSVREPPLELLAWNWTTTAGGSYVEVKGQIKNNSDQTLRNVEAVATFYDDKGGFITSESSLIDFNPILPGQTSPFSVLERHNPAMKKANIEFKEMFGGTIGFKNSDKGK